MYTLFPGVDIGAKSMGTQQLPISCCTFLLFAKIEGEVAYADPSCATISKKVIRKVLNAKLANAPDKGSLRQAMLLLVMSLYLIILSYCI
jgi:hypothetical protein